MSKASFEVVAEAVDAAWAESYELRRALVNMYNHESYLDRTILFLEFLPEIEAQVRAREEQALQAHGWTRAEFDAEVSRQLTLSGWAA